MRGRTGGGRPRSGLAADLFLLFRAGLGVAGAWVAATLSLPAAGGAQELPPVGREAALALTFEPLRWDPPEPTVHEIGGVPVFHLYDPTLPLVTFHARLDGGFAHFSRAWYAVGTALPSLLRNGGSRSLPADSVDAFMERYAVQTSFGGGGSSHSSSMNVLVQHVDTALSVWTDLLLRPRFDPDRVEVWRGRELESVRRRQDDPARLAYGEFNRLMYDDHPVGWEMEAGDLEPADLAPARLRDFHRRVFCRENLVLGVSGDLRWEQARPRMEALVEGWPACPEPLPEVPDPEIRRGGGVFLIPRDVNQSVVIMAHAVGLHLADDPDYFASRIGNAVLGGAGFQSRLMQRVRTDAGYAYSASSLWTAPRDHDGIVGAVTRTRGERTVAAARLVLDVLESMTEAAPTRDEVQTIVSETVNGFVFNFESPSTVLARRMVYEAEGLPGDWLERYLDGTRAVEPGDVLRVFRRWVRPGEMTILVVGDPDTFDEPLSVLGPVTVLDPARPGSR